MRIFIGTVFAILLFSSPALAKVNYELLNTGYTPAPSGGGGEPEWFAIVINNNDGKVYNCSATVARDGTITVRCIPVITGLLTGADVKNEPMHFDATPGFYLWQLDQNSGALALCAPYGRLPAQCVKTQLP
jgi:hypothetical protein